MFHSLYKHSGSKVWAQTGLETLVVHTLNYEQLIFEKMLNHFIWLKCAFGNSANA